jgi:hypothetical protein
VVSSYSWGALKFALVTFKDTVLHLWQNEGLRVVLTPTSETTKQSVVGHMQDDDLYKYLFIGHGSPGGVLPGLDGNHVYNDNFWFGTKGILAADRYTRYGIADFSIIACNSLDARTEWLTNVSPLGFLRLVDGTMRAWNIKRVVVTLP